MSKPVNDIWKDPNVKAALKEGRPVDDIAVLRCPACHRWNYYNQGSTYWCRVCRQSWRVLYEDEPVPDGRYFVVEDFTSLADTITEVTDGYENQTK